MRNRGFTLIEVLCVVGIIGLLMAILLVTVEKVRHRGYLLACASNLHGIGQAVSVYASEHNGQFPRTRYEPGLPPTAGTGANAVDSFAVTGPAANDVTAAFYLLVREQKLPTLLFTCPYNDVFQYTADPGVPAQHANFSDLRQHLGYSFACPYPTDAATKAGYRWDAKLGADFPLAADKNPGIDSLGSNVKANLKTDPDDGNSRNHERDGQNVLYADGHVAWQATALVGPNGDNLFLNKAGQLNAGPVDGTDAVLLPTDDPE